MWCNGPGVVKQSEFKLITMPHSVFCHHDRTRLEEKNRKVERLPRGLATKPYPVTEAMVIESTTIRNAMREMEVR